jgi:very-short-patch-repair endonuclease
VLRRAVNQAVRSGWFNRRGVEEVIARNSRRKGTNQLCAVIASVTPGTRRSRSDLEVAFLLLLEKHGLPRPLVNAKVERFEVDFYWPAAKLIVELDSYEYHRTQHEFANDRIRDAFLKKRRYEVLRVADTWLDADPAGVAETVRTLLGCPG